MPEGALLKSQAELGKLNGTNEEDSHSKQQQTSTVGGWLGQQRQDERLMVANRLNTSGNSCVKTIKT